MAKSSRQQRAEALVARFATESRRSIVVEFAGVPKAGKSSTISQLSSFLKRCGFRVQVVVERASVCPIRDKRHFTFNVWTAATTLAQILEHTQEPPKDDQPQILILDRGLFDSIAWLMTMDRLSRITSEDRRWIEDFLLIDEWRKRITGVIVMTVRPEHAMAREMGHLPVELDERRKGSIMNEKVLAQTLETTRECIDRMRDKFQIEEVDTSGTSKDGPQRTAERVCDVILDWIERELNEDVFHVSKERIISLFGKSVTLQGADGNKVLTTFAEHGEFSPRDRVERDANRVQALPVVIVRNKSGDVLSMRRRERRGDNPLHEKLVLWAGGHVRREDGSNGTAILQAALRELDEELRLNVEANELRLVGAIYADVGERTSKHVAIVYEWRAPSDEVEIALCSTEFVERRGNSLSGRFVPLKELPKELMEDTAEVWSAEIIRNLLPEAATGQRVLY